MITGNIESVKEFMQGLFNGDMFDRFHVSSCMVTTFVEYSIDGKYNKNWFENGEKDRLNFQPCNEIRKHPVSLHGWKLSRWFIR